MIETIKIKNFKSLKNVELHLSGLNILTGFNSTGKSAFTELLLCLRDLNNGDNSAFQDQNMYYNNLKPIEVSVFSKEDNNKWRIKEQYRPKFSKLFDFPIITVVPVEDNGLGKIIIKRQFISRQRRIEPVFLVKNEFLHHPKASSLNMSPQTEAWVNEINPEIKILFDGHDYFVEDYNLCKGIKFAIPLIYAILTAEKDSLLIINHPETCLHPKHQTFIAQMLGRAVLGGVNVIVETHSDHIINGIRIQIKQGVLHPKNVKVFNFNIIINGGERYTTIQEIFFKDYHFADEKGNVLRRNLPKGFMDEWSNAIDVLMGC